MLRTPTSSFLFRHLAAAAVLLGAAVAQADDHGSHAAPPPKYLEECAACHAPFPARGLPAVSWQRLMGNLSQHFGTDASLDAASGQQIGQWLQANAASGRRAMDTPPDERMTRGDWFVRKHDEVGSSVWKRPAIKSASNCAACHPKAAAGDYNEHAVRIPK